MGQPVPRATKRILTRSSVFPSAAQRLLQPRAAARCFAFPSAARTCCAFPFLSEVAPSGRAAYPALAAVIAVSTPYYRQPGGWPTLHLIFSILISTVGCPILARSLRKGGYRCTRPNVCRLSALFLPLLVRAAALSDGRVPHFSPGLREVGLGPLLRVAASNGSEKCRVRQNASKKPKPRASLGLRDTRRRPRNNSSITLAAAKSSLIRIV
jgi:hypothetical protein